MELNQKWVDQAYHEFYTADSGDQKLDFKRAIEAYLTEMFKPGSMMTLEPLEAIPQRDYRKELWIAAFVSEGVYGANNAVAEFDRAFPQEPTHG